MFSITAIMADGQVEKDPLHGLHALLTSIPCIFTYRDTWNPLCVRLLLTTKTHHTIALCVPVGLSKTTPASLKGCCGPWWDLSRRALNLIDDILSTYWKYTLSATTHKLNVSGHMLICTFFSRFGMWDSCPIFAPNFKLHPVFSITVTIWSSFSAMEQTPYTRCFRKQFKHWGIPHSDIFHLHNAYGGVHSGRHIWPVTRPHSVPHSTADSEENRDTANSISVTI
jgi:hypothetical protein